MSETVHGVTKHGVIVFVSSNDEVVITINNEHLIWWKVTGNGGRYSDEQYKKYLGGPMSFMTVDRAQDLALQWFRESMSSIDIDVSEW